MPHRRPHRPNYTRGGYSSTVYVEPMQLDSLVTCNAGCRCCGCPKEAGLDVNEVPPTDEIVPKISEAGLMTGEELDSYIQSTGKIIASVHQNDMMPNANKLPTSFMKSWSDFLDEWRAFSTLNKTVITVFGVSLSDLQNQIDTYLKRTRAFQAQAGSLGGFVPSVPVLIPDHSNPLGNTTKIVASLAVIAGIVVFGPSIVKAFS